MASPNSTFTELVTTTLRDRRGETADNVTNHVPFLKHLRERGNMRTVGGGRSIVEELEYAENSTFKWYSGSEVLDTSPSDILTAAEFDWKQANVNVVTDGLTLHQNMGANALINLADKRISNAERTLINNLSTAVFSDGTGSGGKQLGGLQLLVADDPTTGTVGGIDRSVAANSFWRNQVFDATTDGSATDATTIQANLDGAWIETVRNADHPDLIIMDSVYFNFFKESLVSIQRIASEESAAAGFANLAYYGPGGRATVMYDAATPASHAYLLNTNFIHFVAHSDRNFDIDEERKPTNQDASLVPLFFLGNMTLSNASLQSVYKE